MKNKYIHFIIGLVIGIVISSATVYAASLLSKDITFTPSSNDWEVNNVEDAINDLYDYSRKDTIERLSFDASFNSSQGVLTSRSSSLTLDAGNYIIFSTNYSQYYVEESLSSTVKNGTISLSYSNGTCTDIMGKKIKAYATLDVADVWSSIAESEIGIWKCAFSEQTTISLSGGKSSGLNHSTGIVTLNSVRLN